MRISVVSAEVATLKRDGRPWDGAGGSRLPEGDLPAFFALDLTGQLERLITVGEAPNPPEVFVRLRCGGALLLETPDEESFEPSWREDAEDAASLISPGELTVEVWDRDVMFHDLIGRLTLALPSPGALGSDGLWVLGPFDQVRRLVLRLT